jgi:hypothetical protein
MKAVFHAITKGEFQQNLFFKWLRAREEKAFYNGYKEGLRTPRAKPNHYVPENY